MTCDNSYSRNNNDTNNIRDFTQLFPFGKPNVRHIEILRFRPQSHAHDRPVILHQAAKFHPNQTIRCHIDFQDGGRCGVILLPVSDWMSRFL